MVVLVVQRVLYVMRDMTVSVHETHNLTKNEKLTRPGDQDLGCLDPDLFRATMSRSGLALMSYSRFNV
jgi:hypothetical protein